jgi:hypothetical protein
LVVIQVANATMTQTVLNCEECVVFISKIRQQTKSLFARLLGQRCKQLMAASIAAGCFHLANASHADAHWWNNCYARTHCFVPTYCGWGHYGYSAYAFPYYSHWYSVGPVCYRPISYHAFYARPIVYRPIVYRPIYYRSVVLMPPTHIVDASSSDWFEERDTQWREAENVDWPVESIRSVESIPHSVSIPKTTSQPESRGDLKKITWEEALYGPPTTNPAIRFVAYQNGARDAEGVSIVPEELASEDIIAHQLSAESILVDEMVRSGNSHEAHQTLQSLVAKSGTFDSSLLLRRAVLSLFASKDPIAVELILDRFNEACAAGAVLDEHALGGKISDYLRPSNIDVTNTLNEFSKLALRDEASSVSQYLVVASILSLNGEKARARVFAQAAFDRAAEEGSLQWNSLILKLLR